MLRARARAWRALALACAGELTAAEHAADEVRTRVIPVTPEAASLAALGGAQVSLARDDLLAAQRFLDETDGGRAGHVPGEPPVAAIRALIQARVLLADGAPAAARAVLAGPREGPPLVARGCAARRTPRRRKPRCGPATSAAPARCYSPVVRASGAGAQVPVSAGTAATATRAPAAAGLATVAKTRALAAAARALAAANRRWPRPACCLPRAISPPHGTRRPPASTARQP